MVENTYNPSGDYIMNDIGLVPQGTHSANIPDYDSANDVD